ncbi:MAG: hypothetical protein II458_09090 [Oscillospiraceae bacterium]|nr:hypothetical protein [Oscillospiraceae bacterium]
MTKKYFEIPFVLLTRGPVEPDPGGDDGPGSGSGGNNPYAVGFDEWMALFHEEKDGLDGVTFEDYRLWWIENKLSTDAWNTFNPGKKLTR